jgi:hypothetical protein
MPETEQFSWELVWNTRNRKKNLTRLIWIKRWHREVQASVSYACKLRSMILGSENDRNRYRRQGEITVSGRKPPVIDENRKQYSWPDDRRIFSGTFGRFLRERTRIWSEDIEKISATLCPEHCFQVPSNFGSLSPGPDRTLWYEKRCICLSKRLLHKLKLQTLCRNFVESLEFSILIIVYIKKDWILLHDLSQSFSNNGSTAFSFRKGPANPKDKYYL